MHVEALLALLLAAAICTVLAFLAGLLLRMRPSWLGLLGAGLLGQGLGQWAAAAFGASGWPGRVSLAGADVHLLWTFLGALVVLLVARYVPRLRR
ncbi:MAG TPA: hypothetical protein VND21_00125 [Planctomycetota bacterium]|nr:hypothetical protein [Planctomycetota bacterium]